MELVQLTRELNINATKEEVYDCLHYLTDDDYNGTNGIANYVEITLKTGYVKYISKLEKKMLSFKDDTNLKEFIKEVMEDDFGENDDYYAYELSMTEVYGTLVITVSAIYSY